MISRRRFLTRCAQCAAGLALGGAMWRAHAASDGELPILEAAGGDPLGLGVEQWTRSACDLCGLGEPVFIGTRQGAPVAVKGIARSTVGFGRLCPRVRSLIDAATSEDRATQPLLRRDAKTKGTLAGLEPVSWDEALAAVAAGLRDERERIGSEAVGFLASDGETCETYGLLERVVRAGFGSDQLDTVARLDALHAFEACRDVFGVPANPGCVSDVDAAELIIMIGGDVAESHPSLFYRVLDARRSGRARVVLIDSRKTEAAAVADVHLRARPGHELAIVNALALSLLNDPAAVDSTQSVAAASWRAHLNGSATALTPNTVAPLASETSSRARYDTSAALRASGIDASQVAALRRAWLTASGVVTLVGPTALGTPSAASLARAVAQLHRATGMWGRAGRAALFLPRGANTTAVAAFGIAPGWLPAGASIDGPDARSRIAKLHGVASDRLPSRAGRSALEWPAAVEAGRMGAIVALRSNPAADMPDAIGWRRALARAFVVAATSHVPTETSAYADVVLPLALVAGETAGTTMTLDRRCHLLEQGCTPPGEARPADRVVADLARVALTTKAFAALVGDNAWSPHAEWDRWRTVAAGTRFEAAGITARRLREQLDVAWPCAAADRPGSPHLDPELAPAARYVATPPVSHHGSGRPLTLVIGPLREHARSRVRTGKTAGLHYEAPAAQLEMSPADGVSLGLANGDWVAVESEAGSATVRLWLTQRALAGVVFLPEHFGCVSDLQGGSTEQKEPEGLAHRMTSAFRVSGTGAPAGLLPAVTVRKARRRDMRVRGIKRS